QKAASSLTLQQCPQSDSLPLTAANLCNRARRASLLGDGGVKPTRNRVMNLHRDSQSAVS
ncbi:TPA: hypothetical protein ACN4NF_005261, partial [Escherichia coli O25b:H4-ST131]